MALLCLKMYVIFEFCGSLFVVVWLSIEDYWNQCSYTGCLTDYSFCIWVSTKTFILTAFHKDQCLVNRFSHLTHYFLQLFQWYIWPQNGLNFQEMELQPLICFRLRWQPFLELQISNKKIKTLPVLMRISHRKLMTSFRNKLIKPIKWLCLPHHSFSPRDAYIPLGLGSCESVPALLRSSSVRDAHLWFITFSPAAYLSRFTSRSLFFL